MFVTEADLRDQLRQPVAGATVKVPAGARLSPSAADFVAQWQLIVDDGTPSSDTQWDKPSTFPVVINTEAPRCTCCGMAVTEKSDALTQLNSCHMVEKTHPRIKLRGKLDSLHAAVLMVQAQALAAAEQRLGADLGTLAAYCRELLSAEYNERPAADLIIDGADPEAIHRATHDPRGELGIGHLTIDGAAPLLQHYLNMLRTQARELEIVAQEAFPSPHHYFGPSICHAANRLSSAVYYLQLRLALDLGTRP